MEENKYLPICNVCRWRDVNNFQCFDGHGQYTGRLKCDGFEYKSTKGDNNGFNNNKDNI